MHLARVFVRLSRRAPRSRRGDGADEDDCAEAEGRRREWCSKALTSNTSGGYERVSGGRGSLFRPAHPGRTGPGSPREESRTVVDWDARRARRAHASRERDDGTHVENRGGGGEEEGAFADARARRRALRAAPPAARRTLASRCCFFTSSPFRESFPRPTSLTLSSPSTSPPPRRTRRRRRRARARLRYAPAKVRRSRRFASPALARTPS